MPPASTIDHLRAEQCFPFLGPTQEWIRSRASSLAHRPARGMSLLPPGASLSHCSLPVHVPQCPPLQARPMAALLPEHGRSPPTSGRSVRSLISAPTTFWRRTAGLRGLRQKPHRPPLIQSVPRYGPRSVAHGARVCHPGLTVCIKSRFDARLLCLSRTAGPAFPHTALSVLGLLCGLKDSLCRPNLTSRRSAKR
jgi:hypothetical protein